jgi:arylsulfatase A
MRRSISGVDESLLWQHTRRPPHCANAELGLNGVKKEFPLGNYGPALINDSALDFITRNKERPFFLYYNGVQNFPYKTA